MAALNCTVASVLAREYVFVLTDTSARVGKRGEGGGESDSKRLGAYGRDKLNENPPKIACPIRSRAPTAARDKYVWIIS